MWYASFLGFTNFYKQFIKGFGKIAALFTWILKTTTLLASSKPRKFKSNKKKPNANVNSGVSSDRIDDKDINLLSSTKKISCKADFLIFETKLAFTQIKKGVYQSSNLIQF